MDETWSHPGVQRQTSAIDGDGLFAITDLPAGTVVAHKTGTSGTTDGITAATNDVGLVTLPDGRHLAVAVFVADARGDELAREGAIASLARAAWDAWAVK